MSEADSGKGLFGRLNWARIFMQMMKGYVYFGTDGMGGRVLLLLLCLMEYKSSYNTREHLIIFSALPKEIIILLSDEKNRPVLINRNDGTMKLGFDKFKITVYQ